MYLLHASLSLSLSTFGAVGAPVDLLARYTGVGGVSQTLSMKVSTFVIFALLLYFRFKMACSKPVVSKTATRSDTCNKLFPEYGLVCATEELLGARVPTKRDVISHFLFFTKFQGVKVPRAAHIVVAAVEKRWFGSRIKLQSSRHIKSRVQDIYADLRLISCQFTM